MDAPCTEPFETALPAAQVPASIRTTLLEVVSALQDITGPDDDAVVVAAVVDLFQTGRTRFLLPITSAA
jgi:hypothetical protein